MISREKHGYDFKVEQGGNDDNSFTRNEVMRRLHYCFEQGGNDDDSFTSNGIM